MSILDCRPNPLARGSATVVGLLLAGFTSSCLAQVEWAQRSPASAPLGRDHNGLAYDSARGRTVLFGGHNNHGPFPDTWEWDGNDWTLRPTAIAPPPRKDLAITYDSIRGRVVLFGGQCFGPQFTDTWEYGSTATYEPFGTGCPGSAGLPTLAATQDSFPWLGSTFTLEIASLPSTMLKQAFGVVGLSKTTWGGITLPQDLGVIGLPGCTQYVSLDASVPLAGQGETSTWDIQIPNDQSLLDLEFFLQGVVIDFQPLVDVPPGPARLSVTNAGKGVIGAK